MTPELIWIPGPWAGRLAMSNRARGGDWLDDEVRGWRSDEYRHGRGFGHEDRRSCARSLGSRDARAARMGAARVGRLSRFGLPITLETGHAEITGDILVICELSL